RWLLGGRALAAHPVNLFLGRVRRLVDLPLGGVGGAIDLVPRRARSLSRSCACILCLGGGFVAHLLGFRADLGGELTDPGLWSLGWRRREVLASAPGGCPDQRASGGQKQHRRDGASVLLALLHVIGEVALERAADLLAVIAELVDGLLDLLGEHPLR